VCISNGSKVHRGRVVEARLPKNFLALVQTLEYERRLHDGPASASAASAL
jgi:hypothetical protein